MEPLLVDYLTGITNGTEAISNIAASMRESSCRLPDLIELLEPSLTTKDDKERYRASQLIATLLEYIDIVLSAEDEESAPAILHLFVVFFCRRLQDFPSVLPSLQALSTILRLHNHLLSPRFCDIVDIMESITKSIHVPSYAQNVRQMVWELVTLILSIQSAIVQLQPIGLRVLEGICNSIEEEKDPRCLLLGLTVIRKACDIFEDNLSDRLIDLEDPITALERIFDVTTCYFPISFSPPPDDPIGITSDMLGSLLESCLCEPSPLALMCIPFFLEQINSEMTEARIGALHGLQKIVKIHSHKVLRDSERSSSNRKINREETDDEGDSYLQSFTYLSEVYLLRIAKLSYEIAVSEASTSIVQGVFDLVRAIIFSITKEFTEDNKVDWTTFSEEIIRRALLELSNSVESLKSRAAWKLCIAIANGGGYISASIVIERFLATIVKKVEVSYEMLRVHISRAIDAAEKGIQILPSLAIQEKILPGSIAMLEDIISLSLPSSIDGSGLSETRLLFSQQDSLLNLLMMFSSNLAVNETSCVDLSSGVTYYLDSDVFVAISLSIGAMRELLVRCRGRGISDELLEALLVRMSQLQLIGAEAIFPKALLARVSDIQAMENSLRLSSMKLLISLVAVQEFSSQIAAICFPRLLAHLKANPDANRVGKLIVHLAQASPSTDIIKVLINTLFMSINSYGSDRDLSKDSIALLLDLLATIIAPSEANEQGISNAQEKAMLLVESDSGSSFSLSGFVAWLCTVEISSSPGEFSAETPLTSSFSKLVRNCLAHQEPAVQGRILDSMSKQLSAGLVPRRLRVELLTSMFVYMDKSCDIFKSESSLMPLISDALADAAMATATASSTSSDTSAQSSQTRPTGCSVPQNTALLAILVNKIQSAEAFASLLDGIYNIFIHNQSNIYALEMFFWVLKACLLRPATALVAAWPTKLTDVFLSLLISQSPCLADGNMQRTVGFYVSSRLDFIIDTPELLLSKRSRGFYSPFWQQKLFSVVYPSLTKRIRSNKSSAAINPLAPSGGGDGGITADEVLSLLMDSSAESQEGEKVSSETIAEKEQRDDTLCAMFAFCKLLRGISPALLRVNVAQALDNAVFILSYMNSPGYASSSGAIVKEKLEEELIYVVQLISSENGASFSDHLHLLIPRLLAVSEKGREAKARAAAINCLKVLPTIVSYPKLHPHRHIVIKGLKPVLDDRKRVIRQLASEVRNSWILLSIS